MERTPDVKEAARDAARMLAGLRRRVQKTCLRCGKPIEGVRQRKYCSPTCASAYWQKTHRDRVNASRRRQKERKRGQPHPDTPPTPPPA